MASKEAANPERASADEPDPSKDLRRRLADSPIEQDSGSLTSATRQEMDKAIAAELEGCTVIDDDFFFHFLPSRLINKAADLFKQLSGRSDGKGYHDQRWEMWPQKAEEKDVVKFFYHMVNEVILESSVDAWGFSTQAKNLADGDSARQVDLFVSTQPLLMGEETKTKISWKTVRVVGELKQNLSKIKDTSTHLQLAGCAREAFRQPGRRLVHGFLLCGSMMKCLIYDRCGVVTSEPFDINHEPLNFLKAVLSYAEMNATEIGFDPSIVVNGPSPSPQLLSNMRLVGPFEAGEGAVSASAAKGTTVYDPTFHGVFDSDKWNPYFETSSLQRPATHDHTSSSTTGKERLRSIPEDVPTVTSLAGSLPKKVYIKSEPFFTRRAIVSRGTTCWEGTSTTAGVLSWDLVVKDQWRADTRAHEGNILAAIQGVHGVPELVCYGDVILCNGLDDVKHGIRTKLDEYKVSVTAEQAQTASTSRQAAGSSTPTESRKRHRVFSESSSESASGTTKKRRVGAGSDRRIGAFTNEQENNRIHTRIITTPRGYPLQSFVSYIELVKAVRDAIACHRDIYLKFNVLHRDVSINNVLIRRQKPTTVAIPRDVGKSIGLASPDVHMTDQTDEVSRPGTIPPGSAIRTAATPSTGLLIDFDFAIRTQDLDRQTSTHRTGTFEFIAVEVLENQKHTYRHDLESFFYVLLYCTIFYNGPLDPASSSPDGNLRRPKSADIPTATGWLTAATPQVMSLIKSGITTRRNFEKVVLDMAPQMRENLGELMQDFREALFEVPGGTEPFYGTPKKAAGLYGDVLKAFDKCIAQLDGA